LTIALLKLAIGSSVGRKVGIASLCLIGSVDIVNKLHMVELDTVFDYCCMKEVGCSLIVVDESVDANWESEKTYVNSFDVTVIT
ncbi:hypothetical protein Tco_1525456, partial [Tanacetum coccineum]